jgi:hypothetical protein
MSCELELLIFFYSVDGMSTTRRGHPKHGGAAACGRGGAPCRHEGVHGAMMIEEQVCHGDQKMKIKDYTISHFYELPIMSILFLSTMIAH